MSWAAHEFENYVIQRHAKTSASFLAIALGAFAPDLLTKALVYGVHLGPIDLRSDDPMRFHRSWPGVGFTHSLLFGALLAVLMLRFTRNRPWALGVLLGCWAHALTDLNDTAGSMLFFPLSTAPVSTGMWTHAAVLGRYHDAAAYYSGLGGVWDTFWLLMVLLFARRTLSARYFHEVVRPTDPGAWDWIAHRFRLDDRGLVAIYRGWFFYATCRLVAWSTFTRLRTDQALDLTWAGDHLVGGGALYDGSYRSWLVQVAWGATATAAVLAVAWRLVVARWWREAGPLQETSDLAIAGQSVTTP